jgi:hypothetical protein
VRSRTAKMMMTFDAKRSRPSIGKPGKCHASKERVLLIGTDQRITSGPAATTAAFRSRIHGCTRNVSRNFAPRAPSIHLVRCKSLAACTGLQGIGCVVTDDALSNRADAFLR